MAEYYGVTRTPEYLMHYGVKGMRWGVRKALEKGDMNKLAYHYQRAMNHRDVLKNRTNRKDQKDEAKSYAAAGGLLLGLGGLGGLASYGSLKGQTALNKAINPNSKSYMYQVPIGLMSASGIAAAGGLASLGNGAVSAYRATKRGNKRAIEKYNRFNQEFNKTFNKAVRNKAKKYLVDNPTARLDYDEISNSFPAEKYMTAAEKKAYERAYGKPKLSKKKRR